MSSCGLYLTPLFYDQAGHLIGLHGMETNGGVPTLPGKRISVPFCQPRTSTLTGLPTDICRVNLRKVKESFDMSPLEMILLLLCLGIG